VRVPGSPGGSPPTLPDIGRAYVRGAHSDPGSERRGFDPGGWGGRFADPGRHSGPGLPSSVGDGNVYLDPYPNLDLDAYSDMDAFSDPSSYLHTDPLPDANPCAHPYRRNSDAGASGLPSVVRVSPSGDP